MTGPPIVAPYWFRLRWSGTGAKKFRAFIAPLRRNSTSTVQRVRTRLGHDVDHGARGRGRTQRCSFGLDAEFFESVGVGKRLLTLVQGS